MNSPFAILQQSQLEALKSRSIKGFSFLLSVLKSTTGDKSTRGYPALQMSYRWKSLQFDPI